MAHVDLYNYACLQRMRVGLIWGSFEAINSPGFVEASREVSAHLCYNYERIIFSDILCIYDKCYLYSV